jgi:hypothetical protein
MAWSPNSSRTPRRKSAHHGNRVLGQQGVGVQHADEMPPPGCGGLRSLYVIIRFPLTIEPHGEFALLRPVRNCEVSQLTTIPANELCEPPGPGDGISYSPFSAC